MSLRCEQENPISSLSQRAPLQSLPLHKRGHGGSLPNFCIVAL
jgi:hypothetical protein